MTFLLIFSAAASGIVAAPFILLYFFRLPKFPKARVHGFIEELRRGHIAHRGGLPENTLSALHRAKAQGASAVEVDLSYTKDDHPVLLHDATVDRTSTGRGKVADMTLKQLRDLDFGSKFGPEFAGERLPTLFEAVDLCEELDLIIFLDIKSTSSTLMHTLKKIFQDRPHLYNKICIVSFWPGIIYKVRSMDPNILCGFTERNNILLLYPDGRRRNKEWWKQMLAWPMDRILFWCLDKWIWRLLGISLLLPHKGDILNKRIDVEKWYQRGVYLITWTVNSREEKEYFELVLQIPYMTDCHDTEQDMPSKAAEMFSK